MAIVTATNSTSGSRAERRAVRPATAPRSTTAPVTPPASHGPIIWAGIVPESGTDHAQMHDTLGWMRRRFAQVDVFTAVPYAGNPVAVVLDGDGIGGDDMQRVARWTNLSETTFVLPPTAPDADYRVRIFTPAVELPFAGHPTLGTCHAWLAAGGAPQDDDVIVQQCAAGSIRVRRTDDGLAFAGPPLVRTGPVDAETVEQVAAAFGLDRSTIEAAEWVDNGPGFLALLLADADAVLAAEPSFIDLDVGLVGCPPARLGDGDRGARLLPLPRRARRGPGDRQPQRRRRTVADVDRPASTAPYVASQGTALGRAGRVHVSVDDDGDVWVGGATVDVRRRHDRDLTRRPALRLVGVVGWSQHLRQLVQCPADRRPTPGRGRAGCARCGPVRRAAWRTCRGAARRRRG